MEQAQTFQTQLSLLVSKQLCGGPEAMGELIEKLTDSLGLAIAIASRGNIADSDELLGGVDGYLAETVARHAPMAAFMADAQKMVRGQ